MTPANAEQSKLYRMVAGLEQPAMPMSGTLTRQEMATLKAWIDQGATWERPRQFRQGYSATLGGQLPELPWRLYATLEVRSTNARKRDAGRRTRLRHRPARCEPKPLVPAHRRARTAVDAGAGHSVDGGASLRDQAWIDQGAEWESAALSSTASAASTSLASLENRVITDEERNYWAFKLPVQAPLPRSTPRFTNPIDRFLEAARAEQALTPAPRADRPRSSAAPISTCSACRPRRRRWPRSSPIDRRTRGST